MRELYLLNLDGMRYGIWKHEVRSVRDVRTIHRLPLSPSFIAGITVLDGRSTTLLDLAACIGLTAMDTGQGGRVLFPEGKEAGAGFVVLSPVEEVSIPDLDVVPLPEYVRTDETDTCVMLASVPVPVLSIGRLYTRIHDQDGLPVISRILPPHEHAVRHDGAGIRLVLTGNELFAVPSAGMRHGAVMASVVSPLAGVPRQVKGLVFHEGSVFPAIGLADLLALPRSNREGMMLITELGGQDFGLLIDDDQGSPADGEVVVRELPPIAETGYAKSVVLHQKAVIPLIDPHAALLNAERDGSPKDLSGRYAPDSRFAEVFGKQTVDVTEFSLLGVRHALPRAEVEDVLPLSAHRPLPGALPLVIGVIEHNGEVVPVLDLALVFGRRSIEGPSWSMLLVRNGDFRAFVITEEVYGERTLPREVQRNVPIVLPHKLVYGCYPEGVVVRLILNVEALAVHFDRSLVKDLLPALTREMADAPAKLVPSLLPWSHKQEKEVVASSAPIETAVLRGGNEMPGEAEAADRALKESNERAQREADELERRKAEERMRVEAEARSRAEAEARSKAEEEERQRRVDQERRAADERMRREAEERARREAEETARRAAEERSRQEAEERSRRSAEEDARRSAEERSRRQAEEQAYQEAERKEKAEAEQRSKEEERSRREAEEQLRRKTDEEARRQAMEEAHRDAVEAQRREEERVRRVAEEKAAAAAAVREAERIANEPRQEASSAGGRKYIVAAVAGLVLITLISFGVQHRGGVLEDGKGTQVKAGGQQPAVSSFDERSRTDTVTSQAREKAVREGPLVLTVPAGRPIESDVYVVKKDDTLWSICERFTGNPFNYPRVARDNRIADPDLIFPGQKIFLKR